MRRGRLVTLIAVLPVGAACGARTGLDVPTISDVLAPGATPAFTSPVCPEDAVPAVGAGCVVEGAACEYGKRSDVACNEVLTCKRGTWQIDDGVGDCPNPTATCPSVEGASGADGIGHPVPVPTPACDDVGLTCAYFDAELSMTCVCLTLDEPTARWRCGYRGRHPDCPYPRPRLGAACTGTAFCDYGVCFDSKAYGTAVRCNGTYWELAAGECK